MLLQSIIFLLRNAGILLIQKSGEGSSATSNMSVSMKDLDPAFRGAGQKEYPFLLASLHHMIIMPDNFHPIEIHFQTIA